MTTKGIIFLDIHIIMKQLVVYFSRIGENSVNGQIEIIEKGFTEVLAEKISALTGAPMFKIEPVEPYPFSYDECVKRSRKEDEDGGRAHFLIWNQSVVPCPVLTVAS